MTTITLYKPDGNAQFTQCTNVAVHGSVLTFEVETGAGLFTSKKFRTTIPFLIEEDA